MAMAFNTEMVYRCCSITEAFLRSTSVRIVGLHHTLFQYYELHGWSRELLFDLSYKYYNSQKTACEVFSAHLPSDCERANGMNLVMYLTTCVT